MSLREIIKVPNPFLKVTAKPVTVIDEDILTILDDMMRRRPWATNKDLPFPYPFKKVRRR